ncbi:unnamed protein product, partial [Mesorhabditis spiculigera]
MQKTNATEGIPGEKCRVCGNKPARLCYGSVACGPCKTFFLRVATRKATETPEIWQLTPQDRGSFCIYACGILVPIQQFYHTFKTGYSGLLQGLGMGLNPNDCVEGSIPDFLKATGRELHEKIFPLLRRVRFTFEEFLIWKMVVIFTPGPIGLTDYSRNTIRVARQKYLWMLSKLEIDARLVEAGRREGCFRRHKEGTLVALDIPPPSSPGLPSLTAEAALSAISFPSTFMKPVAQAELGLEIGRLMRVEEETPEIWELEPKDRNMFIMHVSGLVIAIQQFYSTFRSGTEGLLVGMGLHFDPSEWQVEEGIPAFLKKTSIQLHTDIFPTLRAARFTHEEFLIWKMMAIFSPAPIGLTESGSNVIRRTRNKYQSMLVQLIRQNCTEGEAITKMYALMKVHRWFERNANQAAMLATKTFVMGGYEMNQQDAGPSSQVLQCLVCGSRPARRYYGSIACNPCKTFFLRVATRKLPYTCEMQGSCVYQAGRREGCMRRIQEGTFSQPAPPTSPGLPCLIEEVRRVQSIAYPAPFMPPARVENLSDEIGRLARLEDFCVADSPWVSLQHQFDFNLTVSIEDILKNPQLICQRVPTRFCLHSSGVLIPIQLFYNSYRAGYRGLLQGLGLHYHPNDCVNGR